MQGNHSDANLLPAITRELSLNEKQPQPANHFSPASQPANQQPLLASKKADEANFLPN